MAHDLCGRCSGDASACLFVVLIHSTDVSDLAGERQAANRLVAPRAQREIVMFRVLEDMITTSFGHLAPAAAYASGYSLRGSLATV